MTRAFSWRESLIFPILSFSSISLHCSHKQAFLSLLAILWNSAFRWVYLSFSPLLFTSLLFSAICKASSDHHFVFLHLFFLGWSLSLPPKQCHEPPSIVLQELCPSDLIPWIYLSLLPYNHKGFDLGAYLNGLLLFPIFFNLSEFCNKQFMIWATVSSRSCFCWLYRASLSLTTKNIIDLFSVLTIWWCPCVELSLVLLEEGFFCYDQCILLAKLLAFALLHFVLQGQTCLLLQVSLAFFFNLFFQSPVMKRTYFSGVSSIRCCRSS